MQVCILYFIEILQKSKGCMCSNPGVSFMAGDRQLRFQFYGFRSAAWICFVIIKF